jgi:hypothetical protein
MESLEDVSGVDESEPEIEELDADEEQEILGGTGLEVVVWPWDLK